MRKGIFVKYEVAGFTAKYKKELCLIMGFYMHSHAETRE